MKLTGENRSIRGKTCPSATLSTTNPIWSDPVSNLGLRGGRPAANRLSHGTVNYRVTCSMKVKVNCFTFIPEMKRYVFEGYSRNVSNFRYTFDKTCSYATSMATRSCR
jgi:hypothetical protein